MDIVIAVTPVQSGAAGEAQVDVVLCGAVIVIAAEAFLATVDTTVIVHHRRVALVDILRGAVDHVIVEPVGAHGLAPVTRDVDGEGGGIAGPGLGHAGEGVGNIKHLARRARGGGTWIRCIGIDAVMSGQRHRPAVVVELAREEVGAGKAVTLTRLVTVVLVGGDGVLPEARISGDLDRQPIIVAEQDRQTVTGPQQLRRQGAVTEGPQGLRVLEWHAWVEFNGNTTGGAIKPPPRTYSVVIQTAGCEFTH